MKKATIKMDTLACTACSQKIEGAVKAMEGIDKESVNIIFDESILNLKFDDSKVSLEDINETIDILGYDVLDSQIQDLEG